jgi:hypothetical protein
VITNRGHTRRAASGSSCSTNFILVVVSTIGGADDFVSVTELAQDRIVRERGFDVLRLKLEEVAEFGYWPTACQRTYRRVNREHNRRATDGTVPRSRRLRSRDETPIMIRCYSLVSGLTCEAYCARER